MAAFVPGCGTPVAELQIVLIACQITKLAARGLIFTFTSFFPLLIRSPLPRLDHVALHHPLQALGCRHQGQSASASCTSGLGRDNSDLIVHDLIASIPGNRFDRDQLLALYLL